MAFTSGSLRTDRRVFTSESDPSTGPSGVSRLSPHLHFGEVSPAQCWHAARNAGAQDPRRPAGADTFRRELGWREFAHHVLWWFEPGKPERFWWLWPLQAIFLAAFFTNVLPRFRIPPVAIWSGQILALIIVAANPFLISKIDAWATSGWAGTDAAEIQVVDYITNQIVAQGKDRLAIGYQTFIYSFMAEYNITNPIYKVGAELDLLFRYRGGIINTNQCAEGIDFDDEYRVVELTQKPWSKSPNAYFELPRGCSFSSGL